MVGKYLVCNRCLRLPQVHSHIFLEALFCALALRDRAVNSNHCHQAVDMLMDRERTIEKGNQKKFFLNNKKQKDKGNHLLVQFSSVVQSCPTHCNPMDCSTPGFPVHHQLSELTQTHVHWASDVIQPSHPLSSPSPPAFNLYQHQGLFQWVSSSRQMAKVLEFQLQHQSFQWIFQTNFL